MTTAKVRKINSRQFSKAEEKAEFEKMSTHDLKAYYRILTEFVKGTIYCDPEKKVPRHRMLVAQVLSGRGAL